MTAKTKDRLACAACYAITLGLAALLCWPASWSIP